MKIQELLQKDLDQLEDVRQSLGWSQTKMADKLGVSRQAYWQWLRGDTFPDKKNWDKIRTLLNDLEV